MKSQISNLKFEIHPAAGIAVAAAIPSPTFRRP
jgi:hypothetical protein